MTGGRVKTIGGAIVYIQNMKFKADNPSADWRKGKVDGTPYYLLKPSPMDAKVFNEGRARATRTTTPKSIEYPPSSPALPSSSPALPSRGETNGARDIPEPGTINVSYRLLHNSCFIDSLITTILFSPPSYYRDKILRADLSTIEYSAEVIKTPCLQLRGTTKKQPNIYELTSRIQQAFIQEYMNVLSATKPTVCTNLRNIIGECSPDVSSGGIWGTADLYSLLGRLFSFNNLVLISYILEEDSSALANVQDVICVEVGEDYVKYRKEGALNKKGEFVYQLVEGNRPGDEFKINITQPFGKDIVFKGVNYSLFASIINHTGGHYTAFLNLYNNYDQWYRYDNRSGELVKITDTSKMFDSIFANPTVSNHPELNFYRRL